MKSRLLLVMAAAAAPVLAQPQAQCIVAGRLSEGHWAPRFEGIQLRDADGRVVARTDRQALAGVRSAQLTRPALLSRCDGEQPLARGKDAAAGRKAPVPALSRGMVEVEGVSFPKLRSGELVELRVRVRPERVVSVTR